MRMMGARLPHIYPSIGPFKIRDGLTSARAGLQELWTSAAVSSHIGVLSDTNSPLVERFKTLGALLSALTGWLWVCMHDPSLQHLSDWRGYHIMTNAQPATNVSHDSDLAHQAGATSPAHKAALPAAPSDGTGTTCAWTFVPGFEGN